MPELPEVETMRRGIASILGQRIVSVERCPCRLKPIALAPRGAAFTRRVVDRRIVELDRVGKRVVIRLEGDDAIVIEPRMTGLVLVADPPNAEHLRLRFTLDAPRGKRGTRELLYWDRRGLGSVRVVSPREFERRYGLDRIGPDALKVGQDEFRSRLAASRRAIKVALLDQRAVAGVGNLYASEMLHQAAIHPARRCDQLSRDDWSRLHAALVDVLETAIRYEGSTLSDGTYRNALNQAGGYQNEHRVYDRAGQPCLRCGAAAIVRTVQVQRSTFFCPNCQPRRGRRASNCLPWKHHGK
jgi:formamidopyrimidine-DNA glycosylase